MSTLREILSRPGARPQVVRDCEQIIDEEVSSKGFAGLPIKAAHAVVKAIKPGFIPEVIDGLLDDFADRLDPLYQAATAKGEPIESYFKAHSAEAAEALLGITDQRAQKTKHQVVKAAYEKMRSTARKHTEAAIPRVAKMIAKHSAAAVA